MCEHKEKTIRFKVSEVLFPLKKYCQIEDNYDVIKDKFNFYKS